MQNWQHEFGYELISDDLKLAYPRPQPALAQQLRKTIKTARSRQQALAATMPSRYRLNSETQLGNQPTSDWPQGNAPTKSDVPSPMESAGGPSQQSSATSPMAQKTIDSETGTASGNSAGQGQGGSDMQMGMPGRKPGWALKKNRTLGPAITRGVRVLCTADHLALIPARGERGAPIVVQIEGAMQQSIDPFVAALQQYIQGWGLALSGGYWKPELHVEVVAGGEQHFYRLQKYLKRSGIVVTQRIEAQP